MSTYLASIPPAESGGKIAINRLSYQNDWVFCLLLRLHQQVKDYVIICEHHDDVVVSDESCDKPTLHFYQVKTDAAKPFTLARLRRSSEGSSILAKLYRHRKEFGEVARTLNFVSQPPLSGDSVPKAPCPQIIRVADLNEEGRKLISKCLRQELGLTEDPELDEVLFFHRAGLDIAQHERDTIGELVQYIEKRYPDLPYKPKPMYRTIAGEISQKARCEEAIRCPDDIRKHKSISRDDFERMITTCIRSHDKLDQRQVLEHVLNAVEHALQHEQMNFGRLRRIKQNLEKYQLECMENSTASRRCAGEAKRFVRSAINEFNYKLIPLLEEGADYLRCHGVGTNMTDDYLMAVIAWEVFTYDRKLSSTDSESTGEAV